MLRPSAAGKETPTVTSQFSPFAPGIDADPYPAYRALRESDPIHYSPLLDAWVLTRYDDIAFVLSDPRFSANRRQARNRFAQMAELQQLEERFGPFGRAPTMLTSDPPQHTRLRRLVSKAFTARAVEDLRPRIAAIVDSLLGAVRESDRFDIVTDLAYPLPVIVIAEMLGVPPEDRSQFKRWSDDVVATLGGPFAGPEVIQRGAEAVQQLAEYLREIIAQRRRQPRPDLISGLIAAEEQGQVLSEDEILATGMLLLIAGNETTTNLIANGMLALFRHPDELQRLRRNPTLIRPGVEELLRYAGPVQGTARVATADVSIGGRTVSAGQLVFVLIAAANRDPAKFPNPEDLDITRHPNEHLAVGDGIHFCLGAPLARAEAQTAIGALVQRFPHLQLDGQPQWGGTFIIRGVKSLPVRP